MSMVYFPALDIAARRLGLTFSEKAEIVEATLSRMDRGCGVTEAVRMSLIDFLRRKGAYHGALKTLVDTGLVFQARVQNDVNCPDLREGEKNCTVKLQK